MSDQIKRNAGTICAAIHCKEYSNLTEKIFHRFPHDNKRYLFKILLL